MTAVAHIRQGGGAAIRCRSGPRSRAISAAAPAISTSSRPWSKAAKREEEAASVRGDPSSMTLLRPRGVEEALRLYAANPVAVPLAGGTDFMVAWNAGRVERTNDPGSLPSRALEAHHRDEERRSRRRSRHALGAPAPPGGFESGSRFSSRPAPPSAAGKSRPEALSAETSRTPLRRGTRFRRSPSTRPACVFEPRRNLGRFPSSTFSPASRRPRSRRASSSIRSRSTFPRSARAADLPQGGNPRGLGHLEDRRRRASLAFEATDGSGKSRFALGSMAPTVRRLRSVEALLAGKKPTSSLVEEAAALLERDVAPIDDLRSTRTYRLEVSRNLLRAFLRT